MLIVEVLILPSNFLWSLHLIPPLNLGINTRLLSKSTFVFCGTRKDWCPSFFDLNLGNPFFSLKNLVNALSKQASAACSDNELTSFSQTVSSCFLRIGRPACIWNLLIDVLSV